MTIFQSIILGIIQGITEFLPISSSGHLVLAPYYFGWEIPSDQNFVFNVLVQVATLLAVFVYFRNDLANITRSFIQGIIQRQPFIDPHSQMGWYLIVASIPAGIAGLLFKDTFEQAFNSPTATAFFLLFTAILLLMAEQLGKRAQKIEHITWKDALLIGCFQLLALFPGVSRSGSTITGGMIRHLDRPTAARFSFLMSIPIMIVAGAYSLFDLFSIPYLLDFLPPLIAGFFTASFVGYIAIRWLLSFLAKRPLYVFAAYVAGIGLLTLATLLLT